MLLKFLLFCCIFDIFVNAFQSETSGSYCLGFDPLGSGEEVWTPLQTTGQLSSEESSPPKTRENLFV